MTSQSRFNYNWIYSNYFDFCQNSNMNAFISCNYWWLQYFHDLNCKALYCSKEVSKNITHLCSCPMSFVLYLMLTFLFHILKLLTCFGSFISVLAFILIIVSFEKVNLFQREEYSYQILRLTCLIHLITILELFTILNLYC